MDEAYDDFDDDTKPPQPAGKRRQREIFKHQVNTTDNNSTATSSNSDSSADAQSANVAKSKPASDSPRARRGGGKVSTDKPLPDKTKRGVRNDQRSLQRNGWAMAGGNSSPGRKEGAGIRGEKTRHAESGEFPRRSERMMQSSSTENQGDTSDPSKPKPAQDWTPTKSKKIQNTQVTPRKSTTPARQQPQQDAGKNKLVSKSNSSAAENSEAKNARCTPSGPGAPNTSRDRYRSPERVNKSTTANSHSNSGRVVDKKTETEERRTPPRARVTPGRYGEPIEQLQSLSPHKSPLFRPVGRPKADTVRSKTSAKANRPKTTTPPVLQSTFYFASLLKKDDSDEEVNNNDPVCFKNSTEAAGNDLRAAKTVKSAGSKERSRALTEPRLGNGVGAAHPRVRTDDAAPQK